MESDRDFGMKTPKRHQSMIFPEKKNNEYRQAFAVS